MSVGLVILVALSWYYIGVPVLCLILGAIFVFIFFGIPYGEIIGTVTVFKILALRYLQDVNGEMFVFGLPIALLAIAFVIWGTVFVFRLIAKGVRFILAPFARRREKVPDSENVAMVGETDKSEQGALAETDQCSAQTPSIGKDVPSGSTLTRRYMLALLGTGSAGVFLGAATTYYFRGYRSESFLEKEPYLSGGVVLTGFSEFLFFHPSEPGLQNRLSMVLEKLPILPGVFEKMLKKRIAEMLKQWNPKEVEPKSRLGKIYAEACRRLCVEAPPKIFVLNTWVRNACMCGSSRKDAVLIINSELLKSLDEDELLSVVGHELGHYLSGSLTYRNFVVFFGELSFAAMILRILDSLGMPIPLRTAREKLEKQMETIWEHIMRWGRSAELSCDRCGLLACQNLNAALRSALKSREVPVRNVSGKSVATLMELGKQIHEENRETEGKAENGEENEKGSHPPIYKRMRELKSWVDSGEYAEIVNEDVEARKKRVDERRKHANAIVLDALKEKFGPKAAKFIETMKKTGEAARKAKEKVKGGVKGAVEKVRGVKKEEDEENANEK